MENTPNHSQVTRKDRENLRTLVTHVTPANHKRLRQIALDNDTTLQNVVSDAIDLYFAQIAKQQAQQSQPAKTSTDRESKRAR